MSEDEEHVYEVSDFVAPRTGVKTRGMFHSRECPCGRGRGMVVHPVPDDAKPVQP